MIILGTFCQQARQTDCKEFKSWSQLNGVEISQFFPDVIEAELALLLVHYLADDAVDEVGGEHEVVDGPRVGRLRHVLHEHPVVLQTW